MKSLKQSQQCVSLGVSDSNEQGYYRSLSLSITLFLYINLFFSP